MTSVPQWIDEEDSDIKPPSGQSWDRTTPSEDSAMSAALAARRIRVLLVEDAPSDARLVELALSNVAGMKFEVVWADRLHKAVARLGDSFFQVVLLDVGLPDSHGLQTLLKVKESAQDVPIILLTGLEDEQLGLEAITHGAQDFLQKGTDAAAIVRSIQYAIGRHRMKRRLERALKKARSSESNLRTIIDKNLDGIVVLDSTGLVIHANSAADELFGYRQGEFLGREFGMTPSDVPVSEASLCGRHGRTVDVEMRVVEMNLAGTPARMVLLRDRTDHIQMERQREKMLLARRVQEALLPSTVPARLECDLAGASIFADETGGDYFDFIETNDGCLVVVVGDASGHGFGPALLVTEAAAFIHAFAQVQSSVGDVLALAHRSLKPRCPPASFVTAIVVRIDPVARSFTYASAGHPSGILFDSLGNVRAELDSLNQPLVLQIDDAFRASPPVPFDPGDCLVLLSDGIPEAMGSDRRLLGTSRVVELVRQNRDEPAKSLVNLLCRAAQDHCAPAPIRDDATAVVIRFR